MGSLRFSTTPDLLAHLIARLEASLPPPAAAWWNETWTGATEGAFLARQFAGLARHLGRAPLVEPEDAERFLRGPDFSLDLAAFRAADVGAMLLVHRRLEAGGDPAELRDLYDHGDLDERVGVMRCLLVVPAEAPVIAALLGEAQRANAVDIYEAAWCDHDLAVRCLSPADFHRMIMKLAFSDLPLWRVLRGTEGADPELSRMLEDFAREREAAGRPIWPDTLTLQALAPIPGTRERLTRYAASDVPALAERARHGLQHLDQE